MVTETREEKVRRILERRRRLRGMENKRWDEATKKYYNATDFAVELDPDYFEHYNESKWDFFKDEPRYLDPMTREIIASVLLAFRQLPGCYVHAKFALERGATMEQLLEAYEVGHIAGGGPLQMEGIAALKRIHDEQAESGAVERKPAPIIKKDDRENVVKPSETRKERVRRIIGRIERDGGDVDEALAFGIQLDPDYFEVYSKLRWGFFKDEPRHLDPIKREMILLAVMAYRGMREEIYIHTKKALRLGATMEQLLEVYEVGNSAGGSQVLMQGLYALKRVHDEETQSKSKMRK